MSPLLDGHLASTDAFAVPRASNFTNRQKAELFVRDRATCAYTGRSLWLLDGGADPHFEVDWADHIVPVSQGGESTLTNGLCAGYQANSEKRDIVGMHPFRFRRGRPTREYFRTRKALSQKLIRQFERFSRLHYSDWFFNRAVFRLLLGVLFLSEKGCTRSRDHNYYARAALRMQVAWRRITKKEEVPSLEARGLAPRRPSFDQRSLLTIREESTVEGLLRMMRRLVRPYSARL